MIPILDFQRRSLTGPVMKNDEFDLALTRKVRQLVKTYEIKYNPEELIVDDATADAVFQAAVELLADVGLYHIDTFRVIQFTKEEVEAIARDYREHQRKQVFGRGKEEICVEYRTGQESRIPILLGGATGDIEEDWFIPFVQSMAEDETTRGMGVSGGILSVGGVVPKSGTLTEVYCGLWEQRALLEALRRAGRTGMHLGVLSTVFTFGGVLSVLKSGLREPHNTQLGIHIMPEQKIDWSRLLTAYFAEQNGFVPWTSAMSVIGGLCGGPAGTAIGLLANLLGQLAYGHGTLGSMVATHLEGHGGTREALWVYSAAARAAERNVHLPTGGIASANHFYRGTVPMLCQAAASTISATCSGVAYIWGGTGTPLSLRLVDEVMRGAAGMNRERANALINAIMAKTDEALPRETPSVRYKLFPEFYDLETVKPKPEHVAVCNQAAEDLARLGVPYSSRLVIN
ncbi:MAG: monomethylamine:corrinoid methyltransferase [Chloroflexi bacterium]|nr:monomethylamine:corrinoid methyltransferase [Chloroflexota bacterium]